LTTRNNAKVRETTCGYAKGVDGVNTPQPRSGERLGSGSKFAVREEWAAIGHER
jgi:hypothetical protein